MDNQRDSTDLLFWDVDTQFDLMTPPERGGRLYVRNGGDDGDPGAISIVPVLERLSRFARSHNVMRVATGSWRSVEHSEIDGELPDFRDTFPPHCMAGEQGSMKIAETELSDPLVLPLGVDVALAWDIARRAIREGRDIFLHKEGFSCFTGNPATAALLEALNPRAIFVYGVALDVCVRHAVEGMLARDWAVYVVVDAVWGLGLESASDLLALWQEGGAILVTTDEVVRGEVPPTRELLQGRMARRLQVANDT